MYRECRIHPFAYGLINECDHEKLLVCCNGGLLLIKQSDVCTRKVKIKMNLGDRFFTPSEHLQKALSSRVFYRPDQTVVKEYLDKEKNV